MFRGYALTFLTVWMLTLLLAGNALACACCSEPGTYYLGTIKPDSYHLDVVKQFTFAPKADLYMTEAGFETIQGLGPLEAEFETSSGSWTEDFSLAGAFVNSRAWRFTLRSPKGSVGTLVLPMPLKMVTYGVDIHDSEESGLGPLLYKEFRFTGNVASATGFTRRGITKGTNFSLVFQGRGRGCHEVQDFKYWRLEIDGPKAGYAFFGKLSSSDKPWS